MPAVGLRLLFPLFSLPACSVLLHDPLPAISLQIAVFQAISQHQHPTISPPLSNKQPLLSPFISPSLRQSHHCHPPHPPIF
ncbi:uncharacterized protein VTP21DRAFT_5467 [Calcarisporiella thermophila]|uniref:uncharacterized protein n=1 Tax=Calcarisporiella thermophila TaxID=911321 RepID=UPI0037439D52